MSAPRMSEGQKDMTVCMAIVRLVAPSDISRVPASAWCPKGQFISGRLDVKIKESGSMEVDDDPHKFGCHRWSCRCVFRAAAGPGLPGPLVRDDPIGPR